MLPRLARRTLLLALIDIFLPVRDPCFLVSGIKVKRPETIKNTKNPDSTSFEILIFRSNINN